MVKEVETHNSTEILESGLSLDPIQYPDIVTGVLTDDGITLTVVVNRELKAGCSRTVSLSFMLPKKEQQLVAEYALGSFGPDELFNETEEYVFGLGPVKTEIPRDIPEQLADDTVSIRFYSYEANTPFNFGSCYPAWSMIQAYVVGDYVQYGDRLWQCIKNNIGQVPPNSEYWLTTGVPSSGTAFINLPYSVSYPGNQTMPQSTDGWYVLRVLDVEVYNGASAYEVDDIVDYTGGLYKCILDAPAGNDPTDDTYWAALSDEEVANLYDLGYVKVDTIPTILSTNMLITRYVKQKHIYDLLVKTNYKKYDDLKTVIQLEKICSMREAAIIYLRRMDPVRACDMLDQITIDVNSFTVNNGERTNFANATIFTI